MKKLELLSPVGDFECLKAAVQNGADSVYFGASNFNARASATNFDLSDLKDAISYAKLRGVKTHLTLNTLIKDSEFEDAILLAKKAYEFGIDAIIVQDLGLARYLIENFPDLPIHASTQMTIHNLEGVKEAENLGFKRVVLSRELSLEEIEYICAHSKIEIECFIHGALCICYSGQCLFSSMVGGRSGNRGKCAQPCRLPYELIEKNDIKGIDNTKRNIPDVSSLEKGYLLSSRDLCGLEYLPSLIKAGVMCFKIEGRMKSPEYVATVTRIYRKYIDLVLSNKPYVVDKKDIEDLKQVFNRGNFSSGHLSQEPNKNLIYSKKPNHIGIYIGNVANVKTSKGHILLNLSNSLSLGDSITFENENTKYTVSELMLKNKNIESANSGQFVEIGRMKGNIKVGDKIYKVASKELSNIAKASYKNENKKVNLHAQIILKENKPIVLNVKTCNTDNPLFKEITVSFKSDDFPVKARSKPISEERIIEQLSKTNDTIFNFEEIDVSVEPDLFLPSIKILNELRRNALDKIYITAQNRILRRSPTLKDISIKKSNVINNNSKRNISILLNILDKNAKYENLKNVDNIYIPLKYFANKEYKNLITSITTKFDTFIYLPTIIKANYKNLLTNIIDNSIDEFNIKGFVISNLSNIILLEELESKFGDRFSFIGNYTLNEYNQYSISEYQNLGIEKFILSPELDSQTIDSITSSKFNSELIVYGKAPLMNINYCLLGKTNKCYPNCGLRCKDGKEYYLKDRLRFAF